MTFLSYCLNFPVLQIFSGVDAQMPNCSDCRVPTDCLTSSKDLMRNFSDNLHVSLIYRDPDITEASRNGTRDSAVSNFVEAFKSLASR